MITARGGLVGCAGILLVLGMQAAVLCSRWRCSWAWATFDAAMVGIARRQFSFYTCDDALSVKPCSVMAPVFASIGIAALAAVNGSTWIELF